MTTQTKTIQSYSRLKNSRYGNPRFRFVFSDGETLDSKPNAGWAYQVGNRNMREGSTVTVDTDGRGNIRVMRGADES
jgi:hypothetical protein